MGYPDFDARPVGRRKLLSHYLQLSKTRYPYAKPHAYGALDINVMELDRLCFRYNRRFQNAYGVSILFDAFFAWWILRAVERWPILNSCYAVTLRKDGDEIVIDKKTGQHVIEKEEMRVYRSVNLGVAVALPEQLITVAITNAERRNFGELTVLLDAIYGLANITNILHVQKALKPGLEVGTSTITFNNPGRLGSEHGFGIVEPGASAIISVNARRREVTWRGKPGSDEFDFVPVLLVDTSVSFDHRILDGKDVVFNLLRFLKNNIENQEANEALLNLLLGK